MGNLLEDLKTVYKGFVTISGLNYNNSIYRIFIEMSNLKMFEVVGIMNPTETYEENIVRIIRNIDERILDFCKKGF